MHASHGAKLQCVRLIRGVSNTKPPEEAPLLENIPEESPPLVNPEEIAARENSEVIPEDSSSESDKENWAYKR